MGRPHNVPQDVSTEQEAAVEQTPSSSTTQNDTDIVVTITGGAKAGPVSEPAQPAEGRDDVAGNLEVNPSPGGGGTLCVPNFTHLLV